ncbi:MAG: hypothetical protein SOS24_03605, partial [Clostridia bacterium]|nr:hypothetical protein [Clostridia bacterium]
IIHIDFRYTSILTAAGILGLLRQLIIDSGIRPPCALQVSAGTQSRKTTLTELCTRMYNRSDMMSGLGVNAARPDSSLPKISELIDNCKDCVFLLDDLFRTDDKRQKKDMERTVVGILRIYADNSARRNMQSEHKANSQLIITSEYLLNDISNVGRCFYLFIKDKVNLQRLSEAQKTPLALSTAYFYFIKYICCHYDDTAAFIKSEFNRSREQADRHIGKYERIYEMAALLTAAFKILCKYAVEKDVFASSYAEKMISSFKEQISKQVDFHCKHVELLQAQNKQINLSRTLVYLINAKKINLGSKKGDNCFKDKNYIYIKLSYFAKAIYDEYKIRLSAKFISGYFSQKYISEVYRSAKNRTNVKKIDNVNYLVLNIKELKDDAKSARDSIEKIV